MVERSTLPIEAAIGDFKPRPAAPRHVASTADVRKQVDAHASFPSREATEESVQINMRLTVDVAERFKALCKADRRTYGGMIEILLNHFEER